MNNLEELEKIEKNVESSKLKMATLEERKRKLEEEQSKILEELTKEKITEDKLEDVIMDLEVEIQEEITKCQQILD